MADIKNIYIGDKRVEEIYSDSTHKTEVLQIYLNSPDTATSAGTVGIANVKDGIAANDAWQFVNDKGNKVFTKTLIYDGTQSTIDRQSSAVGLIFNYAVPGYQEYKGNVQYGRNWLRLDKNYVSDYDYHYETLDDSTSTPLGIIQIANGIKADTSWKQDPAEISEA